MLIMREGKHLNRLFDFTCPSCHRAIVHGRRTRDVCMACYARWAYVNFEGDRPPPPRGRGPHRDDGTRTDRIGAAVAYRGTLDHWGEPLTVAAIAHRMGLHPRTVQRYYTEAELRSPRSTNGQNILPKPTPVADVEQVHVAWHIAANSASITEALEIAECLDIPVSAFTRRCYVAPAAEVFTGWHLEGPPGWTRCGRDMTAEGLWQHVAGSPGELVCDACLGKPPGQGGLF